MKKKSSAKKIRKKQKKQEKHHKKKKEHYKKQKKRYKKSHTIKKTKSSSDSESYKRLPSGIPNFDRLIEGGFQKNSTNMIVGGAGSGKSIFATQFLVEGLKKGEKCLYVTFEEKKKRFYKNMLEFNWDLEAYEKKDLFTFLEYTPIKVKAMLEEGGGSIETIVLSKKITRIVIDSITSFALLFKDELERREAALGLFNMIRKWSCTSLLTLEEEQSEKETVSKSLEFESDSIIILYFIREREQRKRYLEILKMRGTMHSKKIYHFAIGKRGIEIERESAKDFKA